MTVYTALPSKRSGGYLLEHFDFLYEGMTAEKIIVSLHAAVDEALVARYGKSPDTIISKRVQQEWQAMEVSDTILDVAVLYELTLWLKRNQHPYWFRASAGSSLILYLLGITMGNPLPTHTYCPCCHRVQWHQEYEDGFDIPEQAACTNDGTDLVRDGHNIPWQMLWGQSLWGKSDYKTIFFIDLPKLFRDEFTDFLGTHWLMNLRPNLVLQIRATSLAVILSHIEFNTFINYDGMDETNLKFYEIPVNASFKKLAKRVWETAMRERYEDGCIDRFPAHFDIFSNGGNGPEKFADIISLSGMLSSTGVFDYKVRFMMERLGYKITDMITHREDVYAYLLHHGFTEKNAWKGMNRVRIGCGLPTITTKMEKSGDKWIIDRCKRIQYLFPKAHNIEYLFYRIRIMSSPSIK